MKLIQFSQLINNKFLNQYNTQLIGGFEEPTYLPAKGNIPAQIQFTRDYFNSALHELSHWCIAGNEKRKLLDFGYWYNPDGRTQEQQDLFFKYELNPQAIEWAFSIVTGVQFSISLDNLNNSTSGEAAFKKGILKQLNSYIKKGFPDRTKTILSMLYNKSHFQDTSLEQFLFKKAKDTNLI